MRTEIASPKDVLSSLYVDNKFKSTFEFRKYANMSSRCNGSKYIIVRDLEEIDEECEFRCLFFNRRIRAISQYNEIFVEEYQSQEYQSLICARIMNFMKDVNIPYNCAVVDIYLPKDMNRDIKIIELNHFGGHLPVGSCLYEWDRDSKILFSNRIIPDIRIFD